MARSSLRSLILFCSRAPALLACKIALPILLLLAGTAVGQERNVWIHIDNIREFRLARDLAAVYANRIEGVHIHENLAGQFVIASGPYLQAEAVSRFREMQNNRWIPGQSYIETDGEFIRTLWTASSVPEPGTIIVETLPEPPVQEEPTELVSAPGEPVPEPEEEPLQETVGQEQWETETRQTEVLARPFLPENEEPFRALSTDRSARMEVQKALGWFGHYRGEVDGIFGGGTRRAIQGFQSGLGRNVTGLLTRGEYNHLLELYAEDIKQLGVTIHEDQQAGIRGLFPLGVVEFKRYDPPFAIYESEDQSITVLLISMLGRETVLEYLFEIAKSLEFMPASIEGNLHANSFRIEARDTEKAAYAFAKQEGNEVKGFIALWNADTELQLRKVARSMENSFEFLSGNVLEQGSIAMSPVADLQLHEQISRRQPAMVSSGFFVDSAGTVVTAEPEKSCGRFIIDSRYEMVPKGSAVSGIMFLTPESRIRPVSHATISTGLSSGDSKVAISGYSFGGKLDAPTITQATLSSVTGLNGESGFGQIVAQAYPGDVGGPVFSSTGGVVGMLLNGSRHGKTLPDHVHEFADSRLIQEAATQNGIELELVRESGGRDSESVSMSIQETTVLVECI